MSVERSLTKACAACESGKVACSAESKTVCEGVKADKAVTGRRPDACNDPTSSCYASYWRRRNIDPDVLLRDVNPDAEDLRLALKKSEETAGAELLLVALGGLQSFLEDRAKAEAVEYTVDQLEGRLCDEQYRKYLADTCKLLEADDLSLDEATLVRLKKALLADLARLPRALVEALPKTADPNEEGFRVFAAGASETAIRLAKDRVRMKELPEIWAGADRTLYLDPRRANLRLNCSARQRLEPACFALLLPELAAAAAALDVADPLDVAAELIEAAAQPFCATYGAPNETAHGTCLLGDPARFQAVAADIEKLVRVSGRFVALQRAAERLAKNGMTKLEIAERLLPDAAEVFDVWLGALCDVFAGGTNGAAAAAHRPEPRTESGAAPIWAKKRILGFTPAATSGAVASTRSAPGGMAVASVTLRANAAAVARDYPELLAVIAEAFEPGGALATVKLPREVMASLGFAARLAAAKKPEDAKKVFEEEATPLGTYKLKYDRESMTIAVNAFVGPFAGYGKQYAVEDDDVNPGFVARPLSAPLGVDFTLPSGKWCHFGLMLSVIDPFGPGTIDENAEAEEFDWGAVLTPGAFVRVGIGGSPFTVLGGIVGQPLARSSSSCVTSDGSSAPCWKGALQIGGAIAVDVPLLVLH
jgi:hypothetical protein